ncbi:MAG: endonuclease III [Endomicrobia bacterium]|nr:endonuclease III [Endomicrobiia bacterium]MCL2506753.1 endonuclease III [Endomicrobiia bacterium]
MKKDKKEYTAEIISLLSKEYKKIKFPLNYSYPFELLTAVILSAQCTDERVNIVTQDLFKRYKSIEDYAEADIEELQKYIYSTGFFRNKAKNIIGSANMVLKDFNGEVPQTMEQLLILPGVARKTANVVLGNAFGKSEGIAVDTHVIRIANLLKLTKQEDPVKIEKDLMEVVPKKYWTSFSFLIQTLGRRVCKARHPDCPVCPLNKICPSSKDK